MRLPFGGGGLSQAAVRASSAMLHLLQQHKARLSGRAFALHSSGAAPLPARPDAPLPPAGPMAAAAVLGVLKGESGHRLSGRSHVRHFGQLQKASTTLRYSPAEHSRSWSHDISGHNRLSSLQGCPTSCPA